MPGLRIPSRDRIGGLPRSGMPLTRIRRRRTARLAASWIGSSVKGGISSTARLLTTVPTPHEAAARVRRTRSRRPIDADTSRERGLDDGQCPSSGRADRRRELAGELLEAGERLGPQVVVDERRLPLRSDPARFAEDLEVVADCRLSDVAAGGEVAGADAAAGRELAEDRESGGIGGALEEEDVGVGRTLHFAHCIDKCRYRQVSI